MPLRIEQKQAVVAEVSHMASHAVSVVAAHYIGLTVAELNALRSKGREIGVYLRVVPNKLAKIALEGTPFALLREAMLGPTILAFSQREANAAARLFRDFLKSNEKLQVRALALQGQPFQVEDLERVANLPSWKEAIASLMSAIKAPVATFVRTLTEPQAKLVRTIMAIHDRRQAA